MLNVSTLTPCKAALKVLSGGSHGLVETCFGDSEPLQLLPYPLRDTTAYLENQAQVTEVKSAQPRTKEESQFHFTVQLLTYFWIFIWI